MKYLSVLGRQAEISIAELEALFFNAHKIGAELATFEADGVDINRLGGSLKIAVELDVPVLDYLRGLPEGKITLGVSDYSRRATKDSTTREALKLKKILARHGRSVRVVENKAATLSTATSFHNGLSGKNPRKVELIKVGDAWFRVVGVQDFEAYARRDQGRPARDAKVGMLPPKLAQVLINLCGPLKEGARVLDPFCGTGVLLQEALMMNYSAYGTDVDARIVKYAERNLAWLQNDVVLPSCGTYQIAQGDATDFQWEQPIDAVACEGYLGAPMSNPPAEIKLKAEKQNCASLMLQFLKNLHPQIARNTPVTVAMPAWLRPDGTYSRLEILDEIEKLGYNVSKKSREGLLYCREGQVVARDIIILRNK